jgi:hypothetical protein
MLHRRSASSLIALGVCGRKASHTPRTSRKEPQGGKVRKKKEVAGGQNNKSKYPDRHRTAGRRGICSAYLEEAGRTGSTCMFVPSNRLIQAAQMPAELDNMSIDNQNGGVSLQDPAALQLWRRRGFSAQLQILNPHQLDGAPSPHLMWQDAERHLSVSSSHKARSPCRLFAP